MSTQVKFKSYKCDIIYDKYVNNQRTAILLKESDTGELILIATVNIPEIPIDYNQVIIKDYGENKGILQILISENIISEPCEVIDLNYDAKGHICYLNDNLQILYNLSSNKNLNELSKI